MLSVKPLNCQWSINDDLKQNSKYSVKIHIIPNTIIFIIMIHKTDYLGYKLEYFAFLFVI